MDAVAAIGMGMQGSLEEQLSRLREYEEAVYQFKPHLEELERINQQIQESFVFENRYTQYTMETLRVGWEQLVTSVNRLVITLRPLVSFTQLGMGLDGIMKGSVIDS